MVGAGGTTSKLRVASLLPSATEIVCALGAQDQLVGVSHECDFPPSVANLRSLTSSKLKLSATSGSIDRDVRAVLTDALAIYAIDVDGLAAAQPDVIVTQDLCEVCAVSLDDVTAAAKAVLSPDVRIITLRPTRFGDMLDDVRRVGEALGLSERGVTLAAELQGRAEAVQARAAALPQRPATLTLEWLDPPMVGGTWMPELVEWAGGRALVTETGQPAPTLRRDQLAVLDPAPEVVIVKPCGFRLERAQAEQEVLEDLFDGLPWPALRDGRVWLCDGNAYFNRSGPRLVESLEIMAACLHPEAFDDFARAHGDAFRRWEPARPVRS